MVSGAHIQPEEIALEAARALYGKQAAEMRLYDVRGVSSVTDFTLVANGTSSPHLKALVAEVQRHTKDLGISSHRLSGTPESGWVIIDFIHLVVHIFSPEARLYYGIERLWAKAKELPLPQF